MSLLNEHYREGTEGYLENSCSASVHGLRSSLRVEARLEVEYSTTAASSLSQGNDEDDTKQMFVVK